MWIEYKCLSFSRTSEALISKLLLNLIIIRNVFQENKNIKTWLPCNQQYGGEGPGDEAGKLLQNVHFYATEKHVTPSIDRQLGSKEDIRSDVKKLLSVVPKNICK